MGGGWSATESAGGAPQIHVAAHHTGVRREHVAILGAGVTDCQWTPIGVSLRGMLRTREGGPPASWRRSAATNPRNGVSSGVSAVPAARGRARCSGTPRSRPPAAPPAGPRAAAAVGGTRGLRRRERVAVVCRAGRLHPTGQLRVCTFSAPTPRTRRPWLSSAREARSAVPDRSRPNQAAHRPRGGRDREPGGRGRRRGRRPGGHRGRAGGLLPGQPSNSGIR